MVPPFRSLALVGLLGLLGGSCSRPAPPTPPTTDDPVDRGVRLRHVPTAEGLVQELELELTHTSLGLYVEGKATLTARLSTAAEGEVLRTSWAIESIDAFELTGATTPQVVTRLREQLVAHGKGLAISDAMGLVDVAATDAATANVTRQHALAPFSDPAGQVLVDTLVQRVGLPRLPSVPLELEVPVEVEEESETMLTEADEVLPTTTVQRFTLRGIDDAGVAEIKFQRASVAEPEAETEAGDDADEAEAEPRVHVELSDEGTLLFDVERGVPVSLELTRTERFVLGEREVERSVLVRSRYRPG